MPALSTAEIARRVDMPSHAIEAVLEQEVERGHVQRHGDLWQLTTLGEDLFGRCLRGMTNVNVFDG